MTTIIKYLNVLLFLLSVMFIGCENTSDQPDETFIGEANALRNDEPWNAECIAVMSSSYPDELYLYIDRYNMYRERREAFVVGRIEIAEGRFEIVNGLGVGSNANYYSHYSSHVADGDAIDGEYFVFEADSNYIEITEIDLNTKDFIGKFKVTFLKDTTFNVNPNLPDTLRFSEGEFQTKIQESW